MGLVHFFRMQFRICWKCFALQCLPFYYELLTYQSATLFFSKMTSKRKAYVSADQQQRILQQFYDDLDNDSFLGHSFEGENDANSCSDDDSDESPVENDGPSESDGPIKIENKIDMGLNENAPVDDIVDNPPRKQTFSNLDDVLNLDNYDQLPQQEYDLFQYQNTSKIFTMQWETQKHQRPRQYGRLPVRNILQNTPGPRNATKNVSNLLEGLSLFMPDTLLENIVQHTNQNIEDFYELYPFARGETYATLVDLTDIKSYFGLMYLRTSLKQN